MEKDTFDNQRIYEAIEKCSKCGKCMAVCPVFNLSRNEMEVARGRLELIRAYCAGAIPASDRLIRSVMTCMNCARCSQTCPSGVTVKDAIIPVRGRLLKNQFISLPGKLILRHIIPHRTLYNLFLRLAYYFQHVLRKDRQGSMRHLPLFFKGGRWLPRLAHEPALRRYRRKGEVFCASKKEPSMRVGIFVGCMSNYVYPEIITAMIKLLTRHNMEVIVPYNQVCCGTPALSLGDTEAARRLARKNLSVFKSYPLDAVVLACPSGATTLKTEYPYLLGEDGAWLASRTYDITEFTKRFIGIGNLALRPSSTTTTFHDPCHLRYAQGIKDEPRRILAESSRYVEMDDADKCCGMAGIFSVLYYDLASKIAEDKITALTGSPATTVVTSCPGCMLQLDDQLRRYGIQKDVCHIVEWIAQCLGE